MKSLFPNSKQLRCFFIFIFLSGFYIVSSQDKPVTVEELLLDYYEKDSSAGATFLFDVGTVDLDKVHDKFQMKYTRHSRIKIFNESGFAWADVEIPYYYDKNGNKEDIKIRKAITYNLENGKIVKSVLNRKDFIDEKTSDTYKQIKFAFSNVKPGSIVEYEYEIISPFKYQPRTWYFQHSIPVKYSEYQAEFASFWQYKTLLKSHEVPVKDTLFIRENVNMASFTNRRGKYINYQYSKAARHIVYQNVPALFFEENMICKEDYISKIDFQIIKYEVPELHTETILKTWNDVAIELYDRFDLSQNIKTPEKLEKMLENQSLSVEEKSKIILSYVQQNYEWNGVNSINANQSSRKLQDSRKGNSADLNLHLIRLLKQNGVSTYPVVLSTSSNGRLHYDIPFISQFNYVLPLIADEKGVFFCDATLNYTPYYLVPSKCLNGHGFLVDKEQAQFVELMDISQTQSNYNAFGSFNSTMDTLVLEVNLKAQGYDAISLRNYLLDNDFESIKEKIFPEDENVEVVFKGNIKKDDNNKPLSINFIIKRKVTLRNNRIYINPIITEGSLENPFKSKERLYPIDFRYKQKQKIFVTLQIPQGYSILSVPKNEEYNLSEKGVDFKFKTQVNNNIVQVLSEYNVTNSAIKAEEYFELKVLYDAMIRSHSEYFVISKQQSISMK